MGATADSYRDKQEVRSIDLSKFMPKMCKTV